MYAPYWGLREAPFSNRLDERWFYESPGHAEALARLFFIIEECHQAGLLTAGEGAGKSLVLRLLSQQLSRSRRQLVFIDLNGQDADAFTWRLACELRLAPNSADPVARWWRLLDDALTGSGLARRQTVIVLDHLDDADPSCLAAIERVSSLGRKNRGQVTLIAAARDDSRPDLLRPFQRLTALRVGLPAFDSDQTARYVAQTLERAGSPRLLFNAAALKALYESTRGVPRLVNQLCELSLLAAMHDQQRVVELEVVRNAAAELALPV